jgi:hypothetical protein
VLVRRFVVALGLLLAGAGLAQADALRGGESPVPIGESQEVRNVSAEDCADNLLKERARSGRLTLNARTGHGDEYDRLYRLCARQAERLQQ